MTNPAGSETPSGRGRQWTKDWVPIVGLTALAAALRILLLSDLPPGLYHDEAFNGLDAVSLLQGKHAVFFPANQGREPFFIYLVAATVGALGRSPGAVRLAAAVCGALTVPATYAMARVWFNRRVALLSAATLATMFWHVHLSRIGFRAVALPLMSALMLFAGGWAYRSRRRGAWALTGILWGATFYTYLPARFTPAVVLAFGVYLVWSRDERALLGPALLFGLGALLALVPLGVYAIDHWDIVMGRPGRVSVFNPLINGGDLWGTLGRHLLGTLGMFFVRGDSNPRHNLPGRPVFDPLMAAAMVLGVLAALTRARRREAAPALTLAWVGLMVVPTWLAEDAPHFLRATGVLPPLAVLPGLGLASAADWLERRGWRAGSYLVMAGVLVTSLATSARDYFITYRECTSTQYAFEHAATQLAIEANGFLGTGWTGEGMAAACCNAEGDRQVYLDLRLVDEWASIPLLVAATERVTVFTANDPPSPSQTALVLVWPHSGLDDFVAGLPRNARIAAHPGPSAKGDLEELPYRSYVSFLVEPNAKPPTAYIARFGSEIVLTDYALGRRDSDWEVELEWLALAAPAADYTVSVIVIDQGQAVGQHDGEPCEGTLPTGLWRKGDIVVDRHLVELPAADLADVSVVVGLYEWPAMARLEVRDPNGASLGDQVLLKGAIISEH
ncbi:MAG: glycosyltransferase family 39 protein [Anaerolineae bacterium]